LAFARDTAVVVNKANATKTIALGDLNKMAKLTSKKWPDGKAITFVMKDPTAADMKTAVAKVFGVTPEEVKGLIAANRESFVVVDSDAAVIKTVSATPGAVGFLDVYSITSAINVVKVDGKMPLEPGYALHGQ
jgi:alkyl hydroperoxide reductase subunit AhpC